MSNSFGGLVESLGYRSVSEVVVKGITMCDYNGSKSGSRDLSCELQVQV